MATVLVVGSGAREHALGHFLHMSPNVDKIYFAPGNGGTSLIGTNLPTIESNIDGLVEHANEYEFDLVVIGPEAPLAEGLADILRAEDHLVLGPGARGAQIESSKSWAKELMWENDIPTADAIICTSLDHSLEVINGLSDDTFPKVVKADGLMAGKGVMVCEDRDIALRFARKLFEEHNQEIVLIEECLTGHEVSCMYLLDETGAVVLHSACDYKKSGEGDTGLNTGGMGAYSPDPELSHSDHTFVATNIVSPLMEGLNKRGISYRGVVYVGLMITANGPKVLEFNCRFGDPEAQVVLHLLETDLYDLLFKTATGTLFELEDLQWYEGYSVAVVLAAQGYPGKYENNLLIQGPEPGIRNYSDDALVLFAGAYQDEHGFLRTSGGRVKCFVGRGSTPKEARDQAHNLAWQYRFPGSWYRRDIAKRIIDKA